MSICENCGFNNGKKMSTTQQRKAYFGIAVKVLADHYGYEPKIMHKALAGAFFGFIDVKIGDMVIKVPASTTGRTTKEAIEYYEYIQKIAAERGIDVPSPDPCPQREQ